MFPSFSEVTFFTFLGFRLVLFFQHVTCPGTFCLYETFTEDLFSPFHVKQTSQVGTKPDMD